MATLCNNSILPFTIVIVHGDDIKKVEKIYLSNSHTKTDEQIELKEGLKTGFQFFVDREGDMDKDAKIEIQTSLYNNTDTQESLVYSLTEESITNWVYLNKNHETFPWRMGTYLLRIYYKGISYTTSFYVKPLYLNDNQVKTIHEYLEGKIEGIIYDLVYSNQSLAKQENDVKTNWYYDYARFMMDHKESINYFLLSLENQPISQIEVTHELSRIPGKIDRKTIKWENTRGGLSKNISSKNQTYFYNNVKKEKHNHKANQWMKTILFRWSGDIHTVIDVISNGYDSTNKKIATLKEKAKDLESRKEYIRVQKEVARTEIVDLKAQTTILNKDLKKYKEAHLQQKKWLEHLRSIQSHMVHLLNNSFLAEVERGTIKPLLTINHYYQLNMLYEKSKLIQKNDGDKERHIKIYKPFWQIYEYYCLFTVIDCLKKIGFSLNKLEIDLIESYLQNSVPEGSFFSLENSNIVIHCWYDKYHSDKFIAEQNGDLFFTTQEKKRPDIKLDLYKKQKDGSLLFESCLIFDAKFRKFSNLHSNDYATSTYHQLTSYSLFFYLGENRPTRPVVNKVICLYGSESKGPIRREVFPLSYINLFPHVLDNGQIETRGEKEILEEIYSWIGESYI
jgi:hypothetical protein